MANYSFEFRTAAAAQVGCSLILPGHTHRVSVFIDSGADTSFMDNKLSTHLGLAQELLAKPMKANTIDGHLLYSITHHTAPPSAWDCHYHETLSFQLRLSSTSGHPGLYLACQTQDPLGQKLHPLPSSHECFPQQRGIMTSATGNCWPEDRTADPVEILPASCILGAVTWGIDQKVKQSHSEHPALIGFLPAHLHLQVLQ